MKLNFRTFTIVLALIWLSSCGCLNFNPPRCRMDGCHVRLMHAHGGREFRGQPFWKRNQNPKVGQGFKKTRDPDPFGKKKWWKFW